MRQSSAPPGTPSERAQAPWQGHPLSQAPMRGGRGRTALSFRLERSKGSGKRSSQRPVCPPDGVAPLALSWEPPGWQIFTAILPSYADH